MEDAERALVKIRNLPVEHAFVQHELHMIQVEIQREREATLGTKWYGPLLELLTIPANRYR